MYKLQWFKVAIRRGRANRPSDWRIYDELHLALDPCQQHARSGDAER
jgi:hypothetical protein